MKKQYRIGFLLNLALVISILGGGFLEVHADEDYNSQIIKEENLDKLLEPFYEIDLDYICECDCHDEHFNNNDDYDDEDYYLYGEEINSVETDSEGKEERKKALKELLAKILPSDKLARISKIVENSDGELGMLAYVEQNDTDGKKWTLAYDPKDINLKDLKNGALNNTEMIKSIIHEYAHIESLNNTQVKHGVYKGNKDEIIIPEGKLKKNSYLNLFAKKFWTKEMIKNVGSYDNHELAYLEYKKNPDKYVTEYAASNFIEDFAESFADFVMNDKKTGHTIANKKLNFFYDFPELVKLRTHIRKGLGI